MKKKESFKPPTGNLKKGVDPEALARFEGGADRKSSQDEKKVRITVDLSESEHKALRVAAAETGDKIAKMVRRWVRKEYMQ